MIPPLTTRAIIIKNTGLYYFPLTSCCAWFKYTWLCMYLQEFVSQRIVLPIDSSVYSGLHISQETVDSMHHTRLSIASIISWFWIKSLHNYVLQKTDDLFEEEFVSFSDLCKIGIGNHNQCPLDRGNLLCFFGPWTCLTQNVRWLTWQNLVLYIFRGQCHIRGFPSGPCQMK